MTIKSYKFQIVVVFFKLFHSSFKNFLKNNLNKMLNIFSYKYSYNLNELYFMDIITPILFTQFQ